MAGDRPALVGFLLYLCVAVAPTALFWVAARAGPALVRAVEKRRARPPAPEPLESLVADLRRLRRELRGPAPRTQVRRVALLSAYDEVLADLCRVVDAPAPRLQEVQGRDRDFARLQAEAALEAAGVALEPPGRAA